MKALLVLFGLLTGALCFGDVTGPVTGTLPTNVSAPSNGQCLTYNGTVWVNEACGAGGLPAQAPYTILGNATGSTAAPSALSILPPSIEVQGYDTPLREGATGNGVANDTTYVQACATTGACYIPPGYTFLVTTFSVPTNGTLSGGGNTSIIKCSGSSAACITVGSYSTNCGVNTPNVNAGNFKITGSGVTAFQTNCNYESKYHDIVVSGTFTYNGFAFDASSFCLNLDHLIVDTATIGSTITFSGAVGGAATGTISSGNPGNGSYMMVFSNGEVRRVTISGTTATWTGNIAAGNTGGTASFSTTTASYGAGFYFGSGENCITANMLVSVNGTGTVPFAFLLEDVNGYGQAQAGDVFNTPTAENCQVCLFLGSVTRNITVNSFYCEVCVLPILVGEAAGSYFASGVTINGANISGPGSGATGYANRYAVIDVQAAYSFYAKNIQFTPGDSTSTTAYPLTTAGGVQTTVPKIYAIANAAGVIKACATLYPGDWTTGNPPTSISYTGGNTGSGATFTIGSTGTTPFGELGILSMTCSGGTGYTASTGYVPVTFNGPNGANRGIVIDAFDFNWGISGSLNISSLMAYDSINASGYSRNGYTILNDTGYYNAENGGNLFGSTVNHANENSNREWIQFVCPSTVSGACLSGAASTIGATGSYTMPINSFP